MHSLATRVWRTVRAEDLFPRGASVLAAVSGGPDSVGLLLLLRELAEHHHLVLAGVGHFNHRLRGKASDADEQFCHGLAERLSLPFEVGHADVQALAVENRESIEEAGRRARYGFLKAAAERAGARNIATGHTRDDQAETFLLKLFRGAGTSGLGAIYPRRDAIVRPLLEVTRRELLAYLAELNQPYCEDATNRDLKNPRNRIRHELIPYLRDHFSPGVVEVLARDAALAREEAAWLDFVATATGHDLVLVRDGQVSFDAAGVRAQAAPIRRRIVRQSLQMAAPGRFFGAAHGDRVLDLASGRAAGPVQLPGLTAVLAEGRVWLSPRSGRVAVVDPPVRVVPRELSVPGEVDLPEVGLSLTAVMQNNYGLSELPATAQDEAVVAAGDVQTPLEVRPRKQGDWFKPLGLNGRKKLQDFFVDRKVARTNRDAVPLVVDARDRILWVVGQAVSGDFRVTDPAQGVIILKARRLGGS